MITELRPARQSSSLNSDVADRLKIAVKKGGGNKAVAERSGVKISSLNNYLRLVHRLPADAASKIAHACKVEVRWLLTGEGQMARYEVGDTTEEGHLVVEPFEPQPAEPARPTTLLGSLNMRQMATAIEIAEETWRSRKQNPSSMRKAQVIATLYDALSQESPDYVRSLINIWDSEDLKNS